MALDILVVDDEPDIRELIAGVLGDEGYSVRTAATAEAALEEVRTRTPRLVVLDVWLQGSGMDGLSLLKYLKSIDPLLPVIVISGHGNIETAVAAIRRGAYDFIEKPFKQTDCCTSSTGPLSRRRSSMRMPLSGTALGMMSAGLGTAMRLQIFAPQLRKSLRQIPAS
jgi:DNA-binding NtrC family response regulator